MIQTSGIRNEIEVYDERFLYLTLGNSWVEKLYTGTLWAEGPVYFADGNYLVWSDIPEQSDVTLGRRAGECFSGFFQ